MQYVVAVAVVVVDAKQISRVKTVSGVENQTIGAKSVRKRIVCVHDVVLLDTSKRLAIARLTV